MTELVNGDGRMERGNNIEAGEELGGVGWGRDPREGREGSRQPLDGDGSAPIGREAGGRIEQRVRFPGFGERCARGGWETRIASEVWISGGKCEILGFGLGEVAGVAKC